MTRETAAALQRSARAFAAADLALRQCGGGEPATALQIRAAAYRRARIVHQAVIEQAENEADIESLPLDEIIVELQRRLAAIDRLQGERPRIEAMLRAAGAPTIPEGEAPGPARDDGPPPDRAPAPPVSTPPPLVPPPPRDVSSVAAATRDASPSDRADVVMRRDVRSAPGVSAHVLAAVLDGTPTEWTSPGAIRRNLNMAVDTSRRAMAVLRDRGQIEDNGKATTGRRVRRVVAIADDASPVAARDDDTSRAARGDASPVATSDTPAQAAGALADATGLAHVPPALRPRPRQVPGIGHREAPAPAQVSARVRRQMEREAADAERRAQEPPVTHDPDSLDGRILTQLTVANLSIHGLAARLDESGAVIAMTVRELEREGEIERRQDGKYRRTRL